jgi:hypothetical protein
MINSRYVRYRDLPKFLNIPSSRVDDFLDKKGIEKKVLSGGVVCCEIKELNEKLNKGKRKMDSNLKDFNKLDFKSLDVGIYEIGKEEAKYLLGLNIKNRKPVNAKVSQYLKDIENDNFNFNGASIVIGNDGILMDGQHRLMALELVKLDKKIKTIIVTGINPKNMCTIDTGTTRKASDVLTINKISDSSVLSATVRNVLLGMRTGMKANYIDKEGKSKWVSRMPTNEETLNEYIENKKAYDEAIEFGKELKKGNIAVPLVNPPFYAATYILLQREADKDIVKSFLYDFAKGESGVYGNSAKLLKDFLIKESLKKHRYSKEIIRNLIISTFRNRYQKCIVSKKVHIEKESQHFLTKAQCDVLKAR